MARIRRTDDEWRAPLAPEQSGVAQEGRRAGDHRRVLGLNPAAPGFEPKD